MEKTFFGGVPIPLGINDYIALCMVKYKGFRLRWWIKNALNNS